MPTALGRFAVPVIAVAAIALGTQAVVATPTVPAASSPQAVAPYATVSTGTKAVFVPVTQKRVLSTTSISPTAPRKVTVAGVAGVPSDALAVVVNVAAVKPAKAGYLVAYPSGTTRPPTVFTLTYAAGQVDESVATVKVGSLRQIAIYASTTTPVVVDVVGYYVNHNHDDAYLTKAQAQGRTAADAFLCPAGSLIRSVAADGKPTCVQDATGPVSGVGAGLLLDNGVVSADRSAPNAYTCGTGEYLRAVAANGAPTCAADRDTTYAAGAGLSLANGTFTAEQRRSVQDAFTCPPGQYLRVVAADGTPTCAADVDTNTTYTAGTGLLLTNGVFSAEQGRSAANAFTCPSGQYLQVVAANGAPTCAVDRDTDTDTDTTYEAGFGMLLEGNVFSAAQSRDAKFPFYCESGSYMREVANDGFTSCEPDQMGPAYSAGFGLLLTNGVFSAQQGRSAANAFTCGIGELLRSVAADGTPTCAIDKDTTYTAGFGLNLTGNVFSAQQGRTALSAFTCPVGQALRHVGADGAPTCVAVPAYTAGSGLALNGTTFSSAYGSTVVPIRADGTPTENGTLLRNTMAAVTGATAEKPYVLSLAPGTYDLGAGNALTMRPYVSVVGAGRGFTTITGARVSQSGGLVNLGDQTTLSGVTVRNMVPAGTSFVTAIMSNGANTARLVDVHGYASQEGGETYGLLAFAGGLVTVENSQFTVINPTAIGTGIYAISNTTVRARNVEVGHAAVGGWALHSYNASRIEFADGYANGAVRKGTPDSTLHFTHSKVDGIVNGGVQCFGAYTSAMTAATCT